MKRSITVRKKQGIRILCIVLAAAFAVSIIAGIAGSIQQPAQSQQISIAGITARDWWEYTEEERLGAARQAVLLFGAHGHDHDAPDAAHLEADAKNEADAISAFFAEADPGTVLGSMYTAGDNA